jgi:hypothetical protein
VELTQWIGIGVEPTPHLRLPLSLHQQWFRQHLESGALGYRSGYLDFRHRLYEVFFWTGRAAPSHDRIAALAALESVRPAP